MIFFLNIFSILFLGITAYQDFKNRSVSLIVLLLLLASFACLSVLENTIKSAGIYLLTNFLFTLTELSFIYIYLRMRKKIITFSDTNSFFGYGDVLFLLAACLAFSPLNYILFTLVGTLLSILIFFVFAIGKKDKPRFEIPYAGILACCLILCFIGKFIIRNFSLYNDFFILHFLNEQLGLHSY